MAITLSELEWAVDDVTLPNADGPNKIEPTTASKTVGFDWEQEPSAEEMNWMLNKIYLAIADLDSRTIVAGQLPIGSAYTNFDDSRNPAVILGYGTWESVEGRVVVGIGTATDDRGEEREFSESELGGEYQHVTTVSEMPLHGHPYMSANGNENTDPLGGIAVDNNGVTGSVTYTGTPTTNVRQLIGGAGGNQPHNNMQPYIAAYVWKRTA